MAENTEGQLFKDKDGDPFLLKFLPGEGRANQALRREVVRLNSPANLELVRFVTVIGPTGTGKNHFARVLAGYRQWRKFRESPDAIDLGASYPDGIGPLSLYTDKLGEHMITTTTETLAESLLFGHVEGAFTGANSSYPGLFRDEEYEEILLDEIGEASPLIQAKLLAVLEGREFIPVGGSASDRTKCDKRILMATNRNLHELVSTGEFRKDLFYRIRRHTIVLPRLAENATAIPNIADAIIDRICPDALRTSGKVPVLSAADRGWLQKQSWPGNVRELEEIIELWLYSGASEPIETIAGARQFTDIPSDAGTQNWTTQVRNYIDDVLEGRKKAPDSIGEFLENLTAPSDAAVKAALRAWYQDTKPSADILRRLFPKMQTRSIQTQMSRLGRN